MNELRQLNSAQGISDEESTVTPPPPASSFIIQHRSTASAAAQAHRKPISSTDPHQASSSYHLARSDLVYDRLTSDSVRTSVSRQLYRRSPEQRRAKSAAASPGLPVAAAQRPESVDTDSSADSGIQSNASTEAKISCTPRSSGFVQPPPGHYRYHAVHLSSGEQRRRLAGAEEVPMPPSASSSVSASASTTAMNELQPAEGTRGGIGGRPVDILRQGHAFGWGRPPFESAPRGSRGSCVVVGESGSFGQFRGDDGSTDKGRNSSGGISVTGGWIPSYSCQYLGHDDHRLGRSGQSAAEAFDMLPSGLRPVPDRRADGVRGSAWGSGTREEFLKRRSNSNDSGCKDLNTSRTSIEGQLRSPSAVNDKAGPSLDAHRLSLSTLTTPSASTPKKQSTPNLLRRQLRTITEAVAPLRKSKSGGKRPGNGLHDASLSDLSGDDEIDGKTNAQVSSSSHLPLRPSASTPLSQNSDRRFTSPNSTESPGSRKSRSRFWPKKFGELKSAPSSPELSRKSTRNEELLMESHVTVKTPTNILELTEVERLAFQKMALQELVQLGIGPVSIPKSHRERRKTLKGIFYRKHGNLPIDSTPVSRTVGGETEKEKSSTKTHHWTFGIPLESCVNNDIILGRLTLHGDASGHLRDGTKVGGTGNTQLFDALALSVGSHPGGPRTSHSTLQVPYIVSACCSYLRENALTVKGLFRHVGVRTRVTQLRQKFDCGEEVNLTQHSPHDVTSLLKEFLRDLPQCLLTRDLYQAFVTTASLKSREERLKALRFLVALLPVANRDTLWVLLSLLRDVVENSSDRITRTGTQSPGNCMNSSNLATVFGPSILHRFKSGKSHSDSAEQLNQHHEIIAVVKEMIESFHLIFKLEGEIHREILHTLMEKNPEGADYILCHQDNNNIHRTNNNNYHKAPSDFSGDCTDSRVNSFPTNDNHRSNGWSNEPLGITSHSPIQQAQSRRSFSPYSDPRSSSTDSSGFPVSERSRTDDNNRISQSALHNLRHELLKVSDSNPTLSGLNFQSRQVLHPHNLTSSSELSFKSGLQANLKGPFVYNSDRSATNTLSSKTVASNSTGPSSSSSSVVDDPLSTSSVAGSWEQQRWRYWEELAKKCSEELQEQQTLV